MRRSARLSYGWVVPIAGELRECNERSWVATLLEQQSPSDYLDAQNSCRIELFAFSAPYQTELCALKVYTRRAYSQKSLHRNG
jgi:hypothetical protein